MEKIKIIPFERTHTNIIAPLFPDDWHFDFKKFISIHEYSQYFKGFSLQHKNSIIGFGNLFIFGKNSWLGNIVVDKKYRGKGYGTILTKKLVEEGKKQGVKSHHLFATELGLPVYEKLGFKPELFYSSYFTQNNDFNFNIPIEIKKANKTDFNNIKDLDKQITGQDRQDLLSLFLSNTYIYYNEGIMQGYYIHNLETGFIAAKNQETGIVLTQFKLNKCKHNITLPENNTTMDSFLTQNNFVLKYKVPKMVLGEEVKWQPENVYSRGAGYCG